MVKAKKPRLTVLVSSSVYGKEPLLDLICAALDTFGYAVWNSHLGTLPVQLNAGTYASCLAAVERCDIFFGLITPHYGSGTDGAGGQAITHLELAKAIELDKPRLILAHEQVILARRLLIDLGFAGEKGRSGLKLRKGSEVIDDLRLIDMYEAATQEDRPIRERDNNWVQKYRTEADARRYVDAQFGRYSEMQGFVEEWRVKKSMPK
jgi:hypothetical protein